MGGERGWRYGKTGFPVQMASDSGSVLPGLRIMVIQIKYISAKMRPSFTGNYKLKFNLNCSLRVLQVSAMFSKRNTDKEHL